MSTAPDPKLPMRLRWVRQEDPQGCGIAALAMILGKTYAATKADLVAYLELNGEIADGLFAERGMTTFDWDAFLIEAGYALARVYLYRRNKVRDPWPPKPFADVHLCEIQNGPPHAGHMVVMLRDGSVLDPLTPEPKRLKDYWRVTNVAGVFKV